MILGPFSTKRHADSYNLQSLCANVATVRQLPFGWIGQLHPQFFTWGKGTSQGLEKLHSALGIPDLWFQCEITREATKNSQELRE